MANNTVVIGGRELAVRRQDEPGGLGLLKRVTLASKKLRDGGVDDYPDNAADLIGCYVAHNEGVTRDWLLEQLPADCTAILVRCGEASGAKRAAPGEAASP
jgi:hypothetical protein